MTVTASKGHPLLAYSNLEDIPEGMAPRVVFKLKPECIRKHKGNKKMIELSRIGTLFSQGVAPIAPACPGHSEGLAGTAQKPGATTGAKLPALAPVQDDPVPPHCERTR